MPDETTPPEAVRRVEITQATVNAWKGRPFKWGKADCVRLTAEHLRRMGHQVKLPPASSYTSALTARRRLAERGQEDLIAAIDIFGFERIAPAMCRAGDLLAGPKEEGLGSLGVFVGNGRILAFHEDAEGAEILQPTEYGAAWRVPIKIKGAGR